LHSTSWRYERGRIVLTYAALPDPEPAACLNPVPPAIRSVSAGPLAPSPGSVSLGDVAAHACRHLAYLRHVDAMVAARTQAAPELWALIDDYVPAVAGLLCQPGQREYTGGPVHAA